MTRGAGRGHDGLLQAQIVSDVLVVPTDTLHFPARVIVMLARTFPIVLKELSGVRKRPRIRSVPDHGPGIRDIATHLAHPGGVWLHPATSRDLRTW